ncbi:hypothetical protein Tco_0454161 [Tanacetum coccineum]
MTDHVCVHNSRSAEAKPVPVMDADGSGELRNSCSKFGRFFSISSHSHLIPPIQCSVGCVFADCVAIQDKGYKGNFDLRLRVAGRGTQLLKMINGYGLRRFVASYNPDLLHMEGSKVFVSAAAGSVDTTIDLYWAAIKLPDSFTSGDVLAFYKLPKETIAAESNSSRIRFSMHYQVVLGCSVPWSNERPLENKELNAIIGAWFTLWRD